MRLWNEIWQRAIFIFQVSSQKTLKFSRAIAVENCSFQRTEPTWAVRGLFGRIGYSPLSRAHFFKHLNLKSSEANQFDYFERKFASTGESGHVL